ncbi:hypothetical protein WAX87_16055 [Photobacterium damselae subsp. damselae]|uniref:hypothetical protein n=2 Tax=Photobacterium damselae TaxID=38293 RepID=UPI00165E0A23|nr:hypothetical protein [Photobacterium damselae]
MMKLKQPDPQEINVDYIEKLQPNFYDDGLLVIGCCGYMTDAVMTAIANREKLVELLTSIDHITPLPIAISTNG